MNLVVGDKNCPDNSGGKKRFVYPFRGNNFWKCIWYILSAVTYGKKGHKIWGKTKIYVSKKAHTKLHRDVSEKTDLLREIFYLYCPHYYYSFR